MDYSVPGNYGAISLTGKETSQAVGAVTLDALSFPRCSLLKIDVEGLESAVIQGARALRERDRPFVYVEFNDGQPARETLAVLMGMGYQLYWHPVSFVTDDNFFGRDDTQFRQFDINILGVPPDTGCTLPALRALRHPYESFDPALAPNRTPGA